MYLTMFEGYLSFHKNIEDLYCIEMKGYFKNNISTVS